MSDEVRRLKEAILKDYPRLTPADDFVFSCHPGVKCFNACCGDVNIFLAPYDILRLRKALGITAGEFLKKYTIMPFDENLKYPVIQLKMEDNEKKRCPFVTAEGCSVYADRPWPCRMYPLGLAAAKDEGSDAGGEFYFALKEDSCKGFDETTKWKVAEWLVDQGVADYNRMGREFKNITLHRYFQEGHNLTPEKTEMFFMACYDLDKFRDFVFKSTFFDKFEADDELREDLKSDDVELLRFAYNWLKFALFGEKTMKVKGDVLEAKRKKMEAEGKPPAEG